MGRADITSETIAVWKLQEEGVVKAEAYLQRHMALAEEWGEELYILFTQPELEEMDKDGTALIWIRNHLHVVKVFRNWNGPKDMIVHVYHLRR